MIRFQTPQLPSADDVGAYFAAAEESRWYSNGGPCHELLVDRLESQLGPGIACVPVASGTLGLMVALRALTGRAPPRRRVLMPSFTFAAAVEAVMWAGLEPVFLDVEEQSWHLDPAALDEALQLHPESVGAVLAASTFGTPPSIAERTAWELAAHRAGVPLLVDSAAGFGAKDELGAPLGRQGDAEVFSFHATKTFAIGEGGLVTTTRRSLAARLARLTNFGLRDGVVDEDIGLNAKLADWSAATALAVLDRYADIVAARRARAEQMLAELTPLGYARQAGSERSVWQFVPVLAPSREIRDLALELAGRRGIELRSYFSVPLHCMPAFSGQPVIGDMRRTDDLASRVLSLPMANDLSEAAIESVVECLATAASTAAQRL